MTTWSRALLRTTKMRLRAIDLALGTNMTHDVSMQDEMGSTLAKQRSAFVAEGTASVKVRRDRLDRLLTMTLDNKDRIIEAIRSDYGGHRSAREIQVVDIMGKVNSIKHARKNLERWMRPQRRAANFPFGLLGARASVVQTPKGVVGILSPWNAPCTLAIGPAAAAIAAGNRVMLKTSEFTPATGALIQDLVSKYFDTLEFAVFSGGPDIGAAFTKLRFDHLFFTGNGRVGREVAIAAAANLVPVTLELGGKSPVVVGRSADLARTCEKVVFGKMVNAGQICIAPDYVLVPRELEAAFVEGCVSAARRLFPQPTSNVDYTPIISKPRFERLAALVVNAKGSGARVTVVDDAQPATGSLRMPLHIVQNGSKDMAAMQEEIFGPIMPVMPYDTLEEAVALINAGSEPLALYYFGSDAAEKSYVLAHTRSGGVTFNDTHQHYLQEELPFGGVGTSGSGSYHGHAGFLEFSHPRAVFDQTSVDVFKMIGLKPPYGKRLDKFLASQIKP